MYMKLSLRYIWRYRMVIAWPETTAWPRDGDAFCHQKQLELFNIILLFYSTFNPESYSIIEYCITINCFRNYLLLNFPLSLFLLLLPSACFIIKNAYFEALSIYTCWAANRLGKSLFLCNCCGCSTRAQNVCIQRVHLLNKQTQSPRYHHRAASQILT